MIFRISFLCYILVQVSLNKNLIFDMFVDHLDGYKLEKIAPIYYYSGSFQFVYLDFIEIIIKEKLRM